MKYGKAVVALLIACLASADALSAGDEDRAGTQKNGGNSLVALPYAYYTPETKFAFGVGSIYSFRPSGAGPTVRPSNIRVALTYTQLSQIIMALMPEIYIDNEKYLFNGYFGFYKYPDKFWGIGNDTPASAEEGYRPKLFRSYTNVQKRIVPGLYLGLRYQFEYIKLDETDAEGVLRRRTVPGSEGGWASGLGVALTYDTRDNIYQPAAGMYHQAYAMFFQEGLGSDYSFRLLSLDLRKYFSVFGSHVLALQSFGSFISGEPPFQMMNMFGSSYWMRGYYYGRYRDRHMITFQGEYRCPLFWRFGAVGFAGFGDVGHDIEKFRLDEFKYSIGFGLRFLFDRQERINARLDMGFGEDGNSGIYAMVVEAF